MIPPPYNPNIGYDMNQQMPPPPFNYGGEMPVYQPMQPAVGYQVQMPPMMPPPYMPPPLQNGFPVIGAPVVNQDHNSSYPFFYQGGMPPINQAPSNEDGEKPNFSVNRGYTLYDPNGNSGVNNMNYGGNVQQEQFQPQNPQSDIDDF